MKSPFLQNLLAAIKQNESDQLQALEAAILAAQSNANISPEDELRVKQLHFAVGVIAAVSQGMAPFPASGPTDEDKDWSINYFKARRAGRVRPQHFDSEIEELIQHIAV